MKFSHHCNPQGLLISICLFSVTSCSEKQSSGPFCLALPACQFLCQTWESGSFCVRSLLGDTSWLLYAFKMNGSDEIHQFGFIVDTIQKSQGAIKNIERELVCPSCKELYTHPLILPCQHNICHKCLKELLYLTLEDYTDVSSEASTPGSPRIRLTSTSVERIDRLVRSGSKRNSLTPKITTIACPGCLHDVDLGERGINGLFRNVTLETIVERYRQAARAATAIMCDYCKPPAQESTKTCMDCSASFCNECFKINHPWGTIKAQHEYVGPSNQFRPKVLMCPEHEMEKVNMYCEICRRPVCHLCKLGGAHANHKVTTMSTAYKTLKEKLTKGISYLISKESQVKDQISELETLIEQTESNGERAKEDATCNFEKLYNVLEERKTFVVRSIENSKALRLEKLKNQVEEYQGLLENNGLVGYAQEVLKETDHSCFVQIAKQLQTRIQKASESLKSFQPAAQPGFEEYFIDMAKEEDLLGEIAFSKALAMPEINMEQSKIYNKARICWNEPSDSLSADSYVLEYRRLDNNEDLLWNEIETTNTSKILTDLDLNSQYCFRVKGFRGSTSTPLSKEILLHTPPAPVFNFLFDDKCGYNKEHLMLNDQLDTVESMAGISLLLGAERVQVGCYTCLDYIIGDTGITKGRHFWSFSVESHSYLVKVGVASDIKLQEWLHNPRDISSPRYDQDSGHDSGSEDTSYDSSQPFTLATIGMKKFFIPKSSHVAGATTDRVLPLPTRIGICLDYDEGKVGYYDANNMKCLYERDVDCIGTMYPAFALLGGGTIHLEEVITANHLDYSNEI
ncbi:E3 ubiquitin-protein ligase TRIM36 isoform X3 [Xenopus laevis]|uniref:E3 ubiquitin-protein ligase TRIM36 isoform X3 n=1 Tax=Xenopus laevis TaxID=8355 RepID=A0A8J1M5P4_XENLA|nr:E3 ubiquitin-protein ligase TRIM36 isoform X3 [Xenopus laevis]